MVLLTTFQLAYPTRARAVPTGLAALLQYCLFSFFQRYVLQVPFLFLPTWMPYLPNFSFSFYTLIFIVTPLLIPISSSAFTPGKFSKVLPAPYSILFVVCQFHQRGPSILLIEADRRVVLLLRTTRGRMVSCDPLSSHALDPNCA